MPETKARGPSNAAKPVTHPPEADRPHKFKVMATGDQAKSYDFRAARGDFKYTNIFESIGHLVKACLGGGVVAIHEAYKHCGLLTAFVTNILLGVFIAYSMHILVKSAQLMYGRIQQPKLSYPDLAEATMATAPFPKLRKFDKTFRYIVDITISIDLFGSCCCYSVIMARSLRQLMEGAGYVNLETHPSIRIYIAGFLIPILLICMITSLKYLAPFSLVADVFILTVAASTVYYGIKMNSQPFAEFPVFKDMAGFLEYVGTCVFSIEGFGVALPLENHMEKPREFYLVLIVGMSIVTGVVATIGFFGYYGFGEDAVSPVTLNFPWEPFSIMLKVLMILTMYVTFALNFWVPFDLVWFYLKKRHVRNGDRLWLWERVYRTIIITLIICVAIAFPNVSSFMGLLGSFCISNIGFMFPAVILLIVQWEDPGLGFMKWRLIRFFVSVIFGVCLCILGTYLNMRNLIRTAVDES